MNGIPRLIAPALSTKNTFVGITSEYQPTLTSDIERSVMPLNAIPRLMPGNRQHPETNKTSNVTNSTDPEALAARVFVGNLNTLALNKKDVQSIFCRYGQIIGLSLHKGYAFVQYESEIEARNAVIGEEKRIYAGQQIDLNLVSEPKIRKRKRKMSLDPTDVYSLAGKCQRFDLSPNSTHKQTAPDLLRAVTIGTGATNRHHSQYIKQNSDADILICGNCKELFASLNAIIIHKNVGCRRRFCCKCGPQNVLDIGNAKLSREMGSDDIPCIRACSTTTHQETDYDQDSDSLTSDSQTASS